MPSRTRIDRGRNNREVKETVCRNLKDESKF